MKWTSNKFWLWLEVSFPAELVSSVNMDNFGINSLYDDVEFANYHEQRFGDGPQGPQDLCYQDDGTPVCFELLTFASDFELNGIPSANVAVAVGRRADDTTIISDIHYYVEDLQLQLPATVWCLAKNPSVSVDLGPVWPPEAFRVFVGYLTGSGFSRSNIGAGFTLSMTHWLSALSFSSAISKTSHPLNPAQFFFKATHTPDLEASGGTYGGNTPLSVGPELASAFFNTGVVTTDFWGGTSSTTGLKKWLEFLTTQDRINAVQIATSLGGNLVEAANQQAMINKEACRALRRFEPNARGPGYSETGYVLGVPLAIPANADLNFFISKGIAESIGKEGLAGYTNVTLWDKLAGQFHSDYMYSIVPLVEKALVVPFIPGLSSGNATTLVHRTLYTHEYDAIDLQTIMPRPLRAVGVIMGQKFEAGGQFANAAGHAYDTFGGYFDKWADGVNVAGGGPISTDTRYKEGLVVFKNAPMWMSSMVPAGYYSNSSSGVGSASIQTTTAPTAGVGTQGFTPNQVFAMAKPIWNQYARALYVHEILKNRQGTITGPVRFDIAPGSQLRVEVAEDRYVRSVAYNIDPEDPCLDLYFTWMWCTVLRVSTVIDCQNLRAFTNLYVAHGRSQSENLDSGTSVPYHPIWQTNSWAGCALVQDAFFAPLTTRTLG